MRRVVPIHSAALGLELAQAPHRGRLEVARLDPTVYGWNDRASRRQGEGHAGGAINNNQGKLTIINTELQGNRADDVRPPPLPCAGHGGGRGRHEGGARAAADALRLVCGGGRVATQRTRGVACAAADVVRPLASAPCSPR